MKKLLLFGITFLGMGFGFGQVTIASQDFETVPATPTWAYNNSGGNTSATNTGTPNNQRIRNGLRSFQINNATSTITFGNFSVSGYTNVKVIVRISSISTTAGNGADTGDFLRLFAAVNGAAFATNSEANSDITVKGGAANCRWGYSATGISTNAGTNTVVTGTGGTNQGTIYSTLTINIPDGSSTVGLRINAANDDSNEVWCIDDVTIIGDSSAVPNLAITGTPTNHGSVCVGSSATTVQYTITNTGTAASNVVVSSSDPQFVVSGLSSASIAASGGTATYNVTFTPTSGGAKSTVVSVFYNTSTLSTTSNLSGTGIATVNPAVTTNAASAITASTATLNGNVGTLGVCPNTTERGFIYSETAVNNNPQFGGAGTTKTANGTTTTGAMTLALSGLVASTNYSFVAYVFDGTTYTYGAVQNFTTLVLVSNLSDVISAGGAPATISSMVNDALISNVSQGVQAWQFTVRDGGSTAPDTDAFATIINALNIGAGSGNQIQDYNDAIQSAALFDGNTFIANATAITTNQIQFSGLNLNVPDDATKTYSLRISIQTNPNNSGNNNDNDDFVFSLPKANITTNVSGSGLANYASPNSSPTGNGTNVLSVVATKLIFVAQPTTTNINTNMIPNPTIAGTDANGNIDRDFTGSVSVTSTGTLSPATINANAVAGLATISNVVHTATGTGFSLSASSIGLTGATSISFDIVVATVFKPGELIFVGYDGQVEGSGSVDEYLIATMVDIVPNTTFSIVNSRYEAGAAANVRTNKWGGSGDDPKDPPGVVNITYTGATITAGSVLQIRIDGASATSVKTIVGTTISSDLLGTTFSSTFSTAANISSTSPDQIYLVQGSFTSDGVIDNNQANYILTGTVLHGLTNQAAWVALTSACSGATTGGSTRVSRLHPALTCFNVQNTSGSAISGYYENDKPHNDFKRTILNSIGTASNWTLGTSRYTINPSSNTSNRAGRTFTFTPTSNFPGTWIGDKSGDTQNWFNCGNWEGLAVPDANTDVFLGNTSVEKAFVKNNATFSDDFSDIAQCNNLTISAQEVNLEGSANNKIEVNGNLLIDGTGTLDMSDGNDATADGQLYLKGNWTNSLDESDFKQGNSTVYFNGTTAQIINNVLPLGTEIFYNVVLNNNFNTATSNDVVATGDLSVAAGKTLTIASNDYATVTKRVLNSGTIDVKNNGSLVQTQDGNTNVDGTFKMERIAQIKLHDYVYWSSPIKDTFPVTSISPNTPLPVIFKWNPVFGVLNGSTTPIGNWINTTENMTKGVGYIVRGPSGTSATSNTDLTVNFTGTPNNGLINVATSRGVFGGANYAGSNLTTITKDDDNWNLIGNPYPSAISAVAFLADNPTIDAKVLVWRHGISPSAATAQPFYGTFSQNYDSNDYVTFNASGSVPPGYNGYIPAGQSFMVLAADSAPASSSVNFKNAYRIDGSNAALPNNQFFKTLNASMSTPTNQRIWLSMTGNAMTSNMMVGYISGATNNNDRLFDSQIDLKEDLCLTSVMDNKNFDIQGRDVNFDVNDLIPLGIKISTNGNYTIGITTAEGIFIDGSQTIYLEDKLLNIVHNLTSNPYLFSGTSGTNNDRFVLRFTNTALSNNSFDNGQKTVFVYKNNNVLEVKSIAEKMASVVVYDVLGRIVFSQKGMSTNLLSLESLLPNNSALLVSTVLENGAVVTKKVLF